MVVTTDAAKVAHGTAPLGAGQAAVVVFACLCLASRLEYRLVDTGYFFFAGGGGRGTLPEVFSE